MKISLNSIRSMNKRYGCADDIAANGVDELVEKIGAQLGAIEDIIDVGSKYQGIVIAKVISCEDHPNADRLHVCKLDDGGVIQNVDRDENGQVQVVCGAPNVREGLLVAWLPPGSTVPESVGKDPFLLEARQLRGVVSNGMLASQKELALGDSHDGILEIDEAHGEIKPGTDFAELFGLKDDIVLDIENKMFTHRPDCFGFLGISRELAGIQGIPFKSPDWYSLAPTISGVEADRLALQVRNELPELVPRFCAVVLSNVQVGPSPVWLQVELAKVGLRSINNIVDWTNFFMLETGQPLHAYDYDKVKALSGGDSASIVIRNPRANEKIALLNGKTITPRPEAIMIATDTTLIGVGGVMGGSETEVDETTKNIIIEVATFDMYSVRRTSMAHGLFTDAVTRFNKGQSPLQNLAVLSKMINEVCKFAGGKVASEVIDLNTVAGREWVHPPVPVTDWFINSRLGFSLSPQEMKTLLENVEFKVEIGASREKTTQLTEYPEDPAEGIFEDDTESESVETDLTITAPFWRTDIETREDVVEEIGRLYGYDKLPLELPRRSIKPAQKDALLELKQRIREQLSKAGANEVLTYSFVHGDLLRKVGQNPDDAFKLSNALSPELQYYRLSLTPSLLEKIHPTIKAGYDEFAMFEIGKAHNLQHATSDDGLPMEFEMLDLVYAATDKVTKPGAPFYEARKFLTDLMATFGLQIEFRKFAAEEAYPVVKPYDHTRSAQVFVKGTDLPLGMIGEYKQAVHKQLKLPKHSAGFGIGLTQLQQAVAQVGNTYVPLPRFPKVTQDITLKVPVSLSYQELYNFVWTELAKIQPPETLPTLGPLDIYQSPDDAERKHISFRLSIASYQRTMTDTEVNALLDTVAAAAHEKLGAERI